MGHPVMWADPLFWLGLVIMAVGVVSAVMSYVIDKGHMLETLKKHGHPGYPRAGWEAWRQLALYGRVCREHGYPMWRYRFTLVSGVVFALLALAWLVMWFMRLREA